MTRAMLTALLGAVAGLTFQGAFRLGDIAGLCAAVAVLAAATVSGTAWLHDRFAGRSRAPRPATVALAGVAGWILLVPGAALVLGHGTSAEGYPAFLGDAVTQGPRQLLTVLPPAPATPELLALLGTGVWWAVSWSAAAALASDKPLLLTVLPQTILAVAGTAASAVVGDPHATPVAGAFGLVAVLLLWSEQNSRGRSEEARTVVGRTGASRRSAVSATVPAMSALAAVALVAALAGPRLPGFDQRKPWDPRTRLTPPSVLASDTDPLSQAVAWMKSDSKETLFTERSTAPDLPDRWMVLDAYDGRRWTSSAGYTLAGATIPKASAEQVPAGPVRTVHADIHVTHLPGPWLPAPGAVHAVSAASPVRVDPALGDLADAADGAVSAFDYSVDADVPVFPDATQMAAKGVGSGGSLEAERALPAGLPDSVRQFALQATGGLDPYEELQHLSSVVQKSFRYDPQIGPGPSLGRLDWLVQDPGLAKNEPVATSPDVVATLFAVAARQAGFPTRLVVGFQPPAPDADGGVTVTGADARIWPEAYFAGVGWVPFLSAMPQSASEHGTVTAPPQAIPTGPTTSAEPTTLSPQGAVLQPSVMQATRPPAAHDSGSSPLRWVLAPAVLAVAAGAALWLVPRVRARRLRVRRRADPDPRRRVVWAWQDGLRSLESAPGDRREFATMTPREIAAAAPARWGPEVGRPVARLAELAEAALYAPEPLVSVAADQAWECADEVKALGRRRH